MKTKSLLTPALLALSGAAFAAAPFTTPNTVSHTVVDTTKLIANTTEIWKNLKMQVPELAFFGAMAEAQFEQSGATDVWNQIGENVAWASADVFPPKPGASVEAPEPDDEDDDDLDVDLDDLTDIDLDNLDIPSCDITFAVAMKQPLPPDSPILEKLHGEKKIADIGGCPTWQIETADAQTLCKGMQTPSNLPPTLTLSIVGSQVFVLSTSDENHALAVAAAKTTLDKPTEAGLPGDVCIRSRTCGVKRMLELSNPGQEAKTRELCAKAGDPAFADALLDIDAFVFAVEAKDKNLNLVLAAPTHNPESREIVRQLFGAVALAYRVSLIGKANDNDDKQFAALLPAFAGALKAAHGKDTEMLRLDVDLVKVARAALQSMMQQ